MMRFLVVFGFFMACGAAAQAQVYRCDGPDGTVYSQIPCAPDAREINTQGAFETRHPRPRAVSPGTPGASSAGVRSEGQEVILDWCRGEWPGNFRMQEHCLRTQVEAAQEVAKMNQSIKGNADLENVMGQCAAQWTIPGGQFNWRMVRHCAQRQFDSYGRVR